MVQYVNNTYRTLSNANKFINLFYLMDKMSTSFVKFAWYTHNIKINFNSWTYRIKFYYSYQVLLYLGPALQHVRREPDGERGGAGGAGDHGAGGNHEQLQGGWDTSPARTGSAR